LVPGSSPGRPTFLPSLAADISTLASLINAIAVTSGVIFAALQIRQDGQRRKRGAMLVLVRSLQDAAFTDALRRGVSLPDAATTAQNSFPG